MYPSAKMTLSLTPGPNGTVSVSPAELTPGRVFTRSSKRAWNATRLSVSA